jgi:hypothetical protein
MFWCVGVGPFVSVCFAPPVEFFLLVIRAQWYIDKREREPGRDLRKGNRDWKAGGFNC